MPDVPSIPQDLIRAFAETARRLYVSEDLDETLARLTHAAVEMIPGCEVASISLLRPGGAIVTRGPTDPLAERIDSIQYETGEGPCLSAIESMRLVYTQDTTSDDRWPKFSARTREEQGVGSLLSCRLDVDSGRPRTLGALNLYAQRREAFDESDTLRTILLAASAAVAVDAALNHANLREALESRDVIGQAKGILMARQGISADQAFDMLRHASQRTNVKLRDLAQQITSRRGLEADV